jgi:hypothetical protein
MSAPTTLTPDELRELRCERDEPTKLFRLRPGDFGRPMLQQGWHIDLRDGRLALEWRDVPLVEATAPTIVVVEV